MSRKRAALCNEMLLTGIRITKTGRQSTAAKESTNTEFALELMCVFEPGSFFRRRGASVH